MTKMVYPIYPPEAKKKRVQGDVTLHVLIRKDGSVKVLDVTSGDPLLIPAAEKAVRQWRYKPKLVNGQPVDVDTKLVVSFRLY